MVTLYIVWIKSLFRNFFSNFWQNIVVSICSAIVCSLFIYIFHDFIASRLNAVSTEVQYKAAQWFVYALSSLNAVIIFHFISLGNRSAREMYSFAGGLPLAIYAHRLGERKLDIWSYKILRALSLSGFLGGLMYVVIHRFFAWALDETIIAFHPLVTLFALVAGLCKRKSGFLHSITPWYNWWLTRLIRGQRDGTALSRRWVRSLWKMRGLWINYPPARKLLWLAVALSVTLGFLPQKQWLGALGISLLVGNLVSIAMCLEEAESLRTSTYEKLAGTTHGEYMSSLWAVACISASLFFLITFLLLLFRDTIIAAQNVDLVQNIQLASMSALPTLLVPCVIFQIEPKRAGINALIVGILALFIGTAILAHLASWILLLIVAKLAYHYSHGAYYRH